VGLWTTGEFPLVIPSRTIKDYCSNGGRTKIKTTHDWEWFIQPISADWGMVYELVLTTLTTIKSPLPHANLQKPFVAPCHSTNFTQLRHHDISESFRH